MPIKKRCAALLASILAVILLVVPVSAHGGCGGHRHHANRAQAAPATISVCPLEDCTLAGRHVHDGVAYCGYAHEGGVCDGSCCALCTVEGCTLTGRHAHHDTTYCGSTHSCGFCDGSCARSCR